MDHGRDVAEFAHEELPERREGFRIAAGEGVAVGDHDGVALVPVIAMRIAGLFVMQPHHFEQLLAQRVGILVWVHPQQMIANPRAQLVAGHVVALGSEFGGVFLDRLA